MLFSLPSPLPVGSGSGTLLALALSVLLISHRLSRGLHRANKVSKEGERVVILGASSGIGRALAHEYARRGARVCITARRENDLKGVADECAALRGGQAMQICSVGADFTVVKDMVRVRETLEREWGGVDTVVVCAGVSALRPLMEVAGLERQGHMFSPPHATIEGIQYSVDVANKAVTANYIGPLISAVTLLPLLQSSSSSPSILLISSLAALVPAPTRSLYCSTKAASLMLYQSLAIEHPAVAFSFAIPATVQSAFRASAVDGGLVRENDPNKHALRPDDVARRCLRALDAGEKFVFMPYVMGRFGHMLYWLVPGFIERQASKKYNFGL